MIINHFLNTLDILISYCIITTNMYLKLIRSIVSVLILLIVLLYNGCGDSEFHRQNSALLAGKEFAMADIHPMYTTNWTVVSNIQIKPFYMVTVTNSKGEAAQGFSVEALKPGTTVKFVVVEYRLAVAGSKTFAHFVKSTEIK